MGACKNIIWWFNLGVDWTTGNVINGKKFYHCKNGCLIIHPDGKTIQWFSDRWFDEILVN